MAKTNRISKLYKTRQTAIQLEKLEHRQLLATVTGGGEEVGSDISYQGNVYDQVLMQGAAVSVEADPGQIVRVSWIDGNGDITQGEFSGDGTFTVSLDDFGAPAEPENYNQPGVEYASGHASITIEGSNSSSNVSVFTVGPTTAANFGPLDTGVDLDGVADIARITIVADPSQPGGSTFGGIRTANAMYSDDTGVVGIAADGVQVQSVVLIGDIDASNSGIPTLLFGDNSQFGTVQVAGGDLAQSNGEAINDGGFQTISFIDGMTSDGVLRPAGVFTGGPEAWQSATEYRVTALDSSTDINIELLSQDELNAIFTGKTFTEDVTIVGALAPYQVINAGEFQKNVTFDGDFEGAINLGSVGGDIIFMGIPTAPETEGVDRTVSSDITAGSLGGSLIFGSETDTGDVNYSGTLMTSSMAAGALQVFGDFTGTVTTDGDNDGSFDVGEGALGDISVSGDFSGNAVGILGIGNITIGGTLTSAGKDAFYTASNDTPDGSSMGAVGTLTVTGDVDQDAGDSLINITNNGSFGAITLGGGTDVGLISIDGSQLGRFNGAIDITAAGDVNVQGIRVSDGALDNLTITGDGEGDLSLGDIEAAAIDNVTVSGFGEISLNSITIEAASGILAFTGNTTVNEDITVSHQIGALTINGNADINANITSAWMGPVMIDGNVTFADGMGLVSGDGSVGSGRLVSFEVTGNTEFNSALGANIDLDAGGDFTFGGSVSGMASGTEITASSLGDLSFSEALSGNGQAVVRDLTVSVTPGSADDVKEDGSNLGEYSIGNITVESTNTIGVPGSSLFAGNNTFHALGAIGDISLTGGGSLNAQTPLLSADADKLLFIVGNTSADPTDTPTIDFEGGTVGIGNVSIDVAPEGTDYNTVAFSGYPDASAQARFTGMNILSGVHAPDDQVNSVDNDIGNIVDLWAAYNTAKIGLDTALDGADRTELFAGITAAETALGVPDDPDTEDVNEATGPYVELSEAQAAVDAQQKVIDDLRAELDTANDENSAVLEAERILGAPAPAGEDPITGATGLYKDLADAMEALDNPVVGTDGATAVNAIQAIRDEINVDSEDGGVEDGGLEQLVEDAEDGLNTAKAAIAPAQANVNRATDAHAAAVAANARGTSDDGYTAAYKTAYIADAIFDLERQGIANEVTDNGESVYFTETMTAAANNAWNALSADQKEIQGYEAYIAASASNTPTTWDALSTPLDPDGHITAGMAAWIGQFISADRDTKEANGTDDVDTDDDNTAADIAGAVVRAETQKYWDGLEDEDDDEATAEAEKAASRAAVIAFATREADAEIANEEDADDPTLGAIITSLDDHKAMYNSTLSTANEALGEADAEEGPGAYGVLFAAKEALGDPDADPDSDPDASAYARLNAALEAEAYTALVKAVTDAEAKIESARTDYINALAAANTATTAEDVAAAAADLIPLNEALAKAQEGVDAAMKAVTDAKAEISDDIQTALDAYDKAKEDLENSGALGLTADEILVRNDADLEGTIGDIDIRNSTTLLTATEVDNITSGLIVSVESASAIVAATDVGAVNGVDSLEASKDGVLIGGENDELEEDELLVYIV